MTETQTNEKSDKSENGQRSTNVSENVKWKYFWGPCLASISHSADNVFTDFDCHIH